MSASPSPGPEASSSSTKVNKYNLTPAERQKLQLEKLMKDPTKEVHIPKPPKEKTLRAPREMMKNVQGSSAGAGSGEFHVYKQNRRREYERLKLMDEADAKEKSTREFNERQAARLAAEESKTSKNRLKREKKKARSRGLPPPASGSVTDLTEGKKRKLEGGAAGGFVFRRPGEESEDEDEEEEEAIVVKQPPVEDEEVVDDSGEVPKVVETDHAIVIHEED